MLYKMSEVICSICRYLSIHQALGDQSLSVSHSHAGHLSESHKERQKEERATTGQTDLCCLFLPLVLRNTHTITETQC